jgi:hypothetical protein
MLSLGNGRFVQFVHLGVRLIARLTARGLAPAGIRLALATAASATAATATLVVEILRSHGLFQRLAIIRLGDGRGLDGIDNLVNVLSLVQSFVGEVKRRAAQCPFRRFPVAAAAAAAPPTASSPRLIFSRARGTATNRLFSVPFGVFFRRNQVVDKISRHHLVRKQLFGRRLGKAITLLRSSSAIAPALRAATVTASALAGAAFATTTLAARALLRPIAVPTRTSTLASFAAAFTSTALRAR